MVKARLKSDQFGHAVHTAWDREGVYRQIGIGDQVDCGQIDTIYNQTMLVLQKVRTCLFWTNNIYIFCLGYNKILPVGCAGGILGKCHNLKDYSALFFISFRAEI